MNRLDNFQNQRLGQKNKSVKSGFTIVEILLVVFLIAILATVALNSYSNSTGVFKFLSGYKQVMSTLRTARAYAVSNKNQTGSYSVCISSSKAVVYEDNGDTEHKFELSQSQVDFLLAQGQNVSSCNPVITGTPSTYAKFDEIIIDKNFKFDEAVFELSALDSQATPVAITLPVYFYYENGSGDLTVVDGDGEIIRKDVHQFVLLEFSEPEKARKRYIKIFQISGLPEELVKLN